MVEDQKARRLAGERDHNQKHNEES
jgi:hypothetical protein